MVQFMDRLKVKMKIFLHRPVVRFEGLGGYGRGVIAAILTMLICLCVIFNALVSYGTDVFWGRMVARVAVGIIVVLVPLFFIRLRTWLCIIGLSLLVYPLELSSLLSIKEPLNYNVLCSIFATTAGEALGQLRAYIIPSILYVLVVLSYFILLFRFVRNRYLFHLKFRVHILILILTLGLGLCLPFLANPHLEKKVWNWDRNDSRSYLLELRDLPLALFPFDVGFFSALYVKFNMDMHRILKGRGNPHLNGVHCERVGDGALLSVLVIGETSRACNWFLAGYARQNNPKLSQREGLCFFPNAYSGANATIRAVPMLLSESTPEDQDCWQRAPYLTEVMRDAGFASIWLTVQSPDDAPWSKVAVSGCDTVIYLSPIFPNPVMRDECLYPLVDSLLDTVRRNTFLILHTYGGHFYYPDRYAVADACYLPELSRSNPTYPTPADRDALVNSFDNTICYTDRFLDSIIGLVEATGLPAFVVYAADHGENLYDDEKHPQLLHGSAIPSHYEVHVPYFIWFSSAYRALHPDWIEQVFLHSTMPVMTTATFHTILQLAGIHYSGQQLSKSFADSTFIPPTHRFVVNSSGGVMAAPDFP